jgi:hypothetical protein
MRKATALLLAFDAVSADVSAAESVLETDVHHIGSRNQ